MPRIHLCFLWHMHQPFYKDLATGEYKLPWTRMHALKDYYGMAKILEEFPAVRQTFNLVPSLMVQVAEYASGAAVDPYLQVALKPAESLDDAERSFILKHSFYSDPQRMIYRYPRYGELFDAHCNSRTRTTFGTQEFRDLQMWSQLAWFDEEFHERDPEVQEWIRRGRDFTPGDQRRMGEKQREIMGQVLPIYQKLAASGQIEISTTPFYHPILPLICDSGIAAVSHAGVTLPTRFRYPDDARRQLVRARDYIAENFGTAPVGLWPSEGSVSDEVFTLAAEAGFQWAATDSGVLDRTLDRNAGVDALYRPYEWRQNDRKIGVIFRDHFLSDRIGFDYAKMDAGAAAGDFLNQIRQNCAGILGAGRDALVPIILDGENAWEYYDHNGRPFLRELYRRISEDSGMEAIPIREAFERSPKEPLSHIFPASWISANFDVWIGAEEDNRAWEHLLRARQTLDAAVSVPSDQRSTAMEELMIAEGSDWCWWYGPEHDSANRIEFDQLYRSHLANIYRFLNQTPPDELSQPILKMPVAEQPTRPSGPIRPVIDGEVTSYFEWIGAGIYRVDERSGSMHGKKFPVKEVYFGSDGESLFLRMDFHQRYLSELPGAEVKVSLQALDGTPRGIAAVALAEAGAAGQEGLEVKCAMTRILEAGIPLRAAGFPPGAGVRFQIALWKDALPLESVPQYGWIEMPTTDPGQLGS